MKNLGPFVALILACATMPLRAQGPEWRDNARSTVVMLEGQRADGSPFKGAGIIFGASAERIYIATANHVVRLPGKSDPLKAVRVRFSFLPGEDFPADLLPDFAETMDLAVLRILDPQQGRIPLNRISRNLLRTDAGVREGNGVHAMGYPGDTRWGMSLKPEPVDSTEGDKIKFQSSYVQRGHSGGGLFDQCGNLVGMNVDLSPPNAEAVTIRSVANQLASWGYPIDLAPSKSGTCQETDAPPPPQECTLPVRSEPVGARINVDGKRVGTTPTTLTLKTGRSFELTLEKEGFELFSDTIRCEDRSVDASLEPALGFIRLRYTGDALGCAGQIRIEIGDKVIRPTSNLYTVRDIPLGVQSYEISGTITCAVGICKVSGYGEIDVRNDTLYDIMWQNTGYAQCEVSIYDHSN